MFITKQICLEIQLREKKYPTVAIIKWCLLHATLTPKKKHTHQNTPKCFGNIHPFKIPSTWDMPLILFYLCGIKSQLYFIKHREHFYSSWRIKTGKINYFLNLPLQQSWGNQVLVDIKSLSRRGRPFNIQGGGRVFTSI